MNKYYVREYASEQTINITSNILCFLIISLSLYFYTFTCRILYASIFDITKPDFLSFSQLRYAIYVFCSGLIIYYIIMILNINNTFSKNIIFILSSIVFILFDTFFLSISHLYIQGDYSILTLLTISYPINFSKVIEMLKEIMHIPVKHYVRSNLSSKFFRRLEETNAFLNYVYILFKYFMTLIIYILFTSKKFVSYVYSNKTKKYIKAYKKMYFKLYNYTDNSLKKNIPEIEEILKLQKVDKTSFQKNATYLCIVLFKDKSETLAKITKIYYSKRYIINFKRERIVMDTFVIYNLK